VSTPPVARCIELNVLGTVDEDGVRVGRLATTLRLWEGTEEVVCRVGDDPDGEPIRLPRQAAPLHVLHALLAHVEAVTAVLLAAGTTGLS
jgi:hypothetical protein